MNKNDSAKLGENVFIAPTSYIGGDVSIGESSTIMHLVVIRADIAPISLGARVNVQDGSVLHTAQGVPLEIGDDVGIGHRAVVHCRRVGSRTLIGTGSIVLDNCEIGDRCIVGAGCLLPPNTILPDGKVVMGVPGRIVRDVTEDDLKAIDHVVRNYIRLGREHAGGYFPNLALGR